MALESLDLDYIISKIESLEMDEQARNLMHKTKMKPHLFKGDNPIPQVNVFVSTETKESNEDKDGHFQGNYFFTTSTKSALFVDSSVSNLTEGYYSTKVEVPIHSKTIAVNKAQDVLNLLLKI